MRGKVGMAVPATLTAGITPAYAGKSALMPAAVILFWDHPRLCGEKNTPLVATNGV